jgi:hypothetical protein
MPESDENIPRKPVKISWWKLAVGLLLVIVEIKNWLTLHQEIPDALKTSNETQQGAIYLTSCAIFLVGIGFIIAGVRALWLKRT